jgi:hypothetical protein
MIEEFKNWWEMIKDVFYSPMSFLLVLGMSTGIFYIFDNTNILLMISVFCLLTVSARIIVWGYDKFVKYFLVRYRIKNFDNNEKSLAKRFLKEGSIYLHDNKGKFLLELRLIEQTTSTTQNKIMSSSGANFSLTPYGRRLLTKKLVDNK